MSVYWVRFEGESALAAMTEIAQALRNNDHGIAPTDAEPAPLDLELQPPVERDDYLRANLTTMRSAWSVDPFQPPPSDQRALARAFALLQRLVRRGTWWYLLPPWLQANEFHASVVRVIDSLVEHQRQSQQCNQQNENDLRYLQRRVQALEQQLQMARNESLLAQRQLVELQRRWTAGQPEGET